MTVVVSIALAFLSSLLIKVANVAWDDLWAKLFELVAQAEDRWESGAGEQKKEWVLQQTMIWMDQVLKPRGFQRWILKFAISTLIDSIVKTLNDGLGNDWVAKAKEIEKYLSDLIPVIS